MNLRSLYEFPRGLYGAARVTWAVIWDSDRVSMLLVGASLILMFPVPVLVQDSRFVLVGFALLMATIIIEEIILDEFVSRQAFHRVVYTLVTYGAIAGGLFLLAALGIVSTFFAGGLSTIYLIAAVIDMVRYLRRHGIKVEA